MQTVHITHMYQCTLQTYAVGIFSRNSPFHCCIPSSRNHQTHCQVDRNNISYASTVSNHYSQQSFANLQHGFLVESHQNPETMPESCKTVVTAKISNVLCVQSNPTVTSPPWLQTTVFCRLQSFQPSCGICHLPHSFQFSFFSY